MEKLASTNLHSLSRIGRADMCVALGMAAFWMSAFKRLLYPVMFTYYRTGNEAAVSAQGAYAAIMALCAITLVAGGPKLRRALVAHRWAPACVGLVGAAGMVVLSVPHASVPSDGLALVAGSVLVALYLPVHLAFWCLYVYGMRQSGAWSKARTGRNVGASLALFGIAFAILSFTGLQSSYISVACPLLSSAMIIACPAMNATANEGRSQRQPVPDARPSDCATLEPASAMSASADSVANAPATVSASAVFTDVSAPLSPAPDSALNETASASTAPPAAISAQRPALPATSTTAGAQIAIRTATEASAAPSPLDPAVAQFADDFNLSDREAELAAYTYRNFSARKIAGELFIAESTVYTHQKRIYRKTGVHSKAELIELIDAWKQEQP